MKKTMTLICSMLLGVATVFAQGDGQDPAAKKYLDKLSAKSKDFKTISAKFESRILNEAEGIDIKNKGSILLKGKNYRLEAGGNTIIVNGGNMHTISEECECYINDAPTGDEFGIDPSNMFNLYDSDFKYKLVKDEGNTVIINLYPKKPDDAPFHTITITIDKAKMELSKIKVKGRENNTYEYKILEFKPNVDISDSKLKFTRSGFPCVDDCLDMREEE